MDPQTCNVRVGRCLYDSSGKRTDPVYPGFETIVVLMKSHSKWGVLGPYELRDEKGRIMENIWQSSKIYETVPASKQRKSRYDPTLIWEHPSETHIRDDKITPEYWRWREKLENNPVAVRYPVGHGHRHLCKYSMISKEDTQSLSYVEARKKIYAPVYCNLVKKHPMFQKLQKMLRDGRKLLIVEVDGPHEESMPYYKEHYNVPSNWIENHTLPATKENMITMINDKKHPFGHGYCLAMALLDSN